ncbi:MAG: flagellar biosynthesis protein FlhB [Alphaproteobacteria bacterium]|nr:flagellar biosynthesis protein FlhB [Alphaproteobacteria bacterium]
MVPRLLRGGAEPTPGGALSVADEQEKSEKTEDPTQRRMDKAGERGQVVRSQEVNNFVIIAASAAVIALFSGVVMTQVVAMARPFLETPHLMALEADDAVSGVAGLAIDMLVVLAAPIGLLFVAALAANLGQSRLVFSASKLKLDWGKLSPIKGFRRLLSVHAAVEFLKELVKITIVSAVAGMLIWPERASLVQVTSLEIGPLLAKTEELLLLLLAGVVAAMAVLAGLDLLYERMRLSRELRMSRRDLRDEAKQSEGDPLVRARIRAIRQERSCQRMMAAVPQADVVVTNPTHYAVALKYDAPAMAAPKVVAKGADEVARRIREVATEHHVPLVANPPLAQALYATVDLDAEIPVGHYKAVAEIIGHVMRLRGRAKKAQGQGDERSHR